MRNRLAPSVLFAVAAALYWLLAFPLVRFLLFDPPDSNCGGECGVLITFGDIVGPLAASAAAAAVVGAAFGPSLAERYHDRRKAGAVLTAVAGAVAIVIYAGVVSVAYDGAPLISNLFGVAIFATPFVLAALPAGYATGYLWQRAVPPPGL